MTPIEERAVLPFYLQMMGLNAVRTDPDMTNGSALLPDLVRVGRDLEPYDVKWLLNVGEWRPVVMGAWFSLRFNVTHVGLELRRAMQRSSGSLAAPPLATACVLVTGVESLPALEHYMQTDPGQDGSAQFVAAAAAHLETGRRQSEEASTDPTRFRDMLTFGVLLREAFNQGT